MPSTFAVKEAIRGGRSKSPTGISSTDEGESTAVRISSMRERLFDSDRNRAKVRSESKASSGSASPIRLTDLFRTRERTAPLVSSWASSIRADEPVSILQEYPLLASPTSLALRSRYSPEGRRNSDHGPCEHASRSVVPRAGTERRSLASGHNASPTGRRLSGSPKRDRQSVSPAPRGYPKRVISWTADARASETSSDGFFSATQQSALHSVVRNAPSTGAVTSAAPRQTCLPAKPGSPNWSFRDIFRRGKPPALMEDISSSEPVSATPSLLDTLSDINARCSQVSRFIATMHSPATSSTFTLPEERHPYPIHVRTSGKERLPEPELARPFRGWMHVIHRKITRATRGVALWMLHNAERKMRWIMERWRMLALEHVQADLQKSMKLILFQVRLANVGAVQTWRKLIARRHLDRRKSLLVGNVISHRFFHHWHDCFRLASTTQDYLLRLRASTLYRWRQNVKQWQLDASAKIDSCVAAKIKDIVHMWRALRFFAKKGKIRAMRRLCVLTLNGRRGRFAFQKATLTLLRRRCHRAIGIWHRRVARHKSVVSLRILEGVFRAWVSYTLRKQLDRQQCQRRVPSFRAHWAMRLWAVCASRRSERKRVMRRGTRFAAHTLWTRVFERWRELTSKNSSLRQLFLQWNGDILRKSWSQWLVAHKLCVQESYYMHMAITHHEHFVLCGALGVWSDSVAALRRHHRLTAVCVSHFRSGMLQAYMQKWVGVIDALREERQLQHVALERWLCGTARRAMLAWRNYMEYVRYIVSKEREIVKKEAEQAKTTMLRVIEALRQFLCDKQRRKLHLLYAQRVLQQRGCKSGFASWRRHMRCAKGRAHRAAMADHFSVQWLCLRVVQKWHSRVQEHFLQKEMDRDACYHIRRIRLRHHVRVWAHLRRATVFAGQKGHCRAVGVACAWFAHRHRMAYVEWAARKVKNCRSETVFKTWHKAYTLRRFGRNLAAASCRSVFVDWRRFTATHVGKRKQCLSVLVASCGDAHTRRCFTKWAVHIRERDALCRAQSRQWQARTAFKAWILEINREKGVRQAYMAKWTGVCTNLKQKALLAWHSATQEGQSTRQRCSVTVIQTRDEGLLAKAFQQWKREVSQRDQMRVIEHVLQSQRGQVMLSRCFRFWHKRMVQFRKFRTAFICSLRERSLRAWRFWMRREQVFTMITYRLVMVRRMRMWKKWRESLERSQFLTRALSHKALVLDPTRYLQAWHAHTLQKSINRGLDQIVVSKVREGLVRRRVRLWSLAQVRARKLRRMQIFVVNRFYFDVAQKTVSAWRRRARAGRINREVHYRTLSTFFGTWKAWRCANTWALHRSRHALTQWRTCVTRKQRSMQFYDTVLAGALRSSWDGWAEVCRASRAKQAHLVDLMGCFAGRNYVVRAQQVWTAWYRLCEERRRLAQRQVEVHTKSISRRLRRWQQSSQTRRRLAHVLSTVVNSCASGAMSRIFAAWREHLATAALTRQTYARCATQIYHSKQKRVIQCWHRTWQVRNVVSLFLTTQLRTQTAKILDSWRRIAAQQVRQSHYLVSKDATRSHALLHSIVRAWRGQSASMRWVRNMLRQHLCGARKWFVAWSTDAHVCTILRTSICQWHQECARIRGACDASRGLFLRYFADIQRSCFLSLTLYWTRKRAVRRRSDACHQFLRRRRSQSAVAGWHRHTHLQGQLHAARCRLGEKRQLMVLREWRAVTERTQHVTASARRLSITYLSSMTFQTFTAWSRRVLTVRQSWENGQQVAKTRHVRERREWLRRWHTAFGLHKQLLKASALLFANLLHRVYFAWRDVATAKRIHRDHCEKLRECIVARKRRCAVLLWHVTVSHSKQQKRKILCYLQQSNRDFGKNVFDCWRLRICSVKEERARCQAVSERLHQRTVSERFQKWWQYAQCLRNGRRHFAFASMSLTKTAWESWRYFHKTCVGSKYRNQVKTRLLRHVVLHWARQCRAAKVGISCMVDALQRPVVRTLRLFPYKLAIVYEWATTLRQILCMWSQYARQQHKFTQIRRVVARCRAELLLRNSMRCWTAFAHDSRYLKGAFRGWRRMVSATRLFDGLSKLDAKYTQTWWTQRFCGSKAVRNIIREFNRLSNNGEKKRDTPIEVVAGLYWQRRQLHMAFSRLAMAWGVREEWPFLELSAPVGGRLHLATLRILEARMDQLAESNTQSSLAALFDFYYQNPHAKDIELPLASTLCDLMVVTLGASLQAAKSSTPRTCDATGYRHETTMREVAPARG